MKKLSQYIKENKLFEEETNKYLIDVNYINENLYERQINEGLMDWFNKFFSKTSNFLNKWIKRGGKKIDANINKGNLKVPQSIKTDIEKLKKDFKSDSIYGKLFPEILRYTTKHDSLIPLKDENSKELLIKKEKWNNEINQNILYFKPNNNFEGEYYPIAVMIFSPKIVIEEGYLHIFKFEMTNIANGITEKDCFKYLLENNNITKYNGITYSLKDSKINNYVKKLSYKSYNDWQPLEQCKNIVKLTIK